MTVQSSNDILITPSVCVTVEVKYGITRIEFNLEIGGKSQVAK